MRVGSSKQIKYYFSIPESSIVTMLNGALLNCMGFHPDWFYDDFEIDSVYGCFDRCIWNGNRNFLGERLEPWRMEELVRCFSSFGIAFRLTFTNQHLKPEHLDDKYGNTIADIVSKYRGMAIVSTALMYDFITANYLRLDISWSTTTDFGATMEERIAKINELSRDRVVVIPYDLNNKPVLRDLLHPGNIEIIVNEECIDNCPRRLEHELLDSQRILEGSTEQIPCLMQEYKGTEKWVQHSMVGRDGLKKYVSKGINKFKVSGRIDLVQTYDAYCMYFIKPEFWKDFYYFLNNFHADHYPTVARVNEGSIQQDGHVYKVMMFDDYIYEELLERNEHFRKVWSENDGLW